VVFGLFLIVAGMFAWNNMEIKNVSAVGEEWLTGWKYRKQIEVASGKVGTMNGDVSLIDNGKFNKSVSFDGTGDYVSISSSDDFSFGTGDFTIDFWIKKTSRNENIMGTGYTNNWMIHYDTVNGYAFYGNGNGTGNYLGGVTADNNWHHIAFIRSSGTLSMYKDGQLTNSVTNTTNITATTSLYIGRDFVDSMFFSGSLDEVRISKGTARWTSNFTPPISAYTADEHDVLLLHMDGRDQNNIVSSNLVSGQTDYQFKVDVPYNNKMNADFSDVRFTSSDGSTQLSYWIEEDKKKVGIINGNPVLGSTGKFGTSMALDGTDDYIGITSSDDLKFGTGDFTIDMWVNPTVISSDYNVMAGASDGSSYNWMFSAGTGDGSGDQYKKFHFYSSLAGVSLCDSSVLTINNWTHVAVVRSGNTWTLYKNGVSVATATSSSSFDPTYQLRIGGLYYYNAAMFHGYIDEVRISKGIARWTANFTPPTSAYTADAYDKLLLHLDETVGSTKVESSSYLFKTGSVSGNSVFGLSGKFGTAMGFDGTNDYISFPDSTDWDLNGDFTIDFWINSSNISAYQFPLVHRAYSAFTGAWHFYISGSKFVFSASNNSGTAIISLEDTTTRTSSTWYHVAIVRSGATANMYVNGSLAVSDTSASGEISADSAPFIVGYLNNYGGYFNGILDEVRISKGIARWTSNFTPPTSAYTADAYDKLLLHLDEQASSVSVVNETTIPFWVKASSLSDSNKVYLYYGKEDALTTSNGDNTFVFFDDFNSTISASKWFTRGSYSLSNGELIMTGTADFTPAMIAKSNGSYLELGPEHSIMSRYKHMTGTTASVNCFGFTGEDISTTYLSYPGPTATFYFQDVTYVPWIRSGSYTDTNTTITIAEILNTYHKYELRRESSAIKAFMDNNKVGETSVVPSGNLKPFMESHNSPARGYMDWYAVKKGGTVLASIGGEESVSGFLMKKADGCSCTEAIECYSGLCSNGWCGIGGPTVVDLIAPSEL